MAWNDTAWNDTKAEQIAKEINDADRILVGLGYGFSAAAGLETIPLDQRVSTKHYWKFWLPYIQKFRLNKEVPPLYGVLAELISKKDYFIIDGNADGMIYRCGLDMQRIYKAQGDMARVQCRNNCNQKSIVGKKYFDKLLLGESISMVCPDCGAPLIMNVYSKSIDGKQFCMEPYREKNNAWFQFVNAEPQKRLAIVELGCGYTMPELIRFPMEQITMNHNNAVLIRINTKHPLCVEENSSKAICAGVDIAEALPKIVQFYKA